MAGNVMTMRAVPGIEIPAGGKAELMLGGSHVMLMELRGPLVEGKEVPLTRPYCSVATPTGEGVKRSDASSHRIP